MKQPQTLVLDRLRPQGARLIEASAGTGKTYTIAGLYLLLVVEEGLQVEEILVMTFTKAATAELRERIRTRLVEARQGFQAGAHTDPFLAAIIARYGDAQLALQRLERALVDFDQAAVFTIHSFCQRALVENAFESGAPFEVELLASQDDLVLEVLADFWRREVCAGDPRFVGFLMEALGARRPGPEALLQQLRPHLGKPYVLLRGPEGGQDLKQGFADFLAAWERVRECWRESGVDVLELLRTHPGVNRSSYRKDVVARAQAALEEFLAVAPAAAALCKNFERFTNAALEKAAKPGATPPSHRFFDCCDALEAAVEQYRRLLETELAAFKLRALRRVREDLDALKRRRQVQGFDDLLINLHRALSGAGGDRLVAKLRQVYRAALIDEFQDTDPLQYDIFRQVFLQAGVPLFLVGDPKQAIYSFRGADIHAYLAAKGDVPQGYTLGTNWRSDGALVAAVNALFEQAPRPFLLERIGFQAVAAANGGESRLRERGQARPPLRLWCLGPEHGAPGGKAGDDSIGKTAARGLIAEAAAAEIARLLSLANAQPTALSLDGRPLEGGDIAVLVRTHRQGEAVVAALQERGISCVQQSKAKVFESAEAAELERLLLAVLEPGHEARVRAALAGRFIGAGSEWLLRLAEDEAEWNEVLERFAGYHTLWRQHGFMRCFRQFLRDYGVYQRLLGYVDGERRLTNILHLGELLHAQAAEIGLGMEGLLGWLVQQRREPDAGEAAELRLESDERLVKVVTIHASKGLEYPIVFCPFLWDGPDQRTPEPPLAFHDPAQAFAAVLDFGPRLDPDAVASAQEEALAEDLRLAYVALTRAKHRCYVVWGKCGGLEASGLGWLLHGRHAGEGRALEAMAHLVGSRALAELRRDLEALAIALPQSIVLEPLPSPASGPLRLPVAAAPLLRPREFERGLSPGWRLASFSGLAGRVGAADEEPDHDAEPAVIPARQPLEGIFAFPRGGRPGTCLHSIYQYWDFIGPDRDALEALVARMLSRHGFSSEWTATVADNVQRVLATPLDDQGLRLASLTRAQRLDELEFYYPIKSLESAALARLLRMHGFLADVTLKERVGRLQFALGQGYMKGFIDLVFESNGRYYLVDYKSNWLGGTIEEYGLEQVAGAMAAHDYYLQYLIYTVALHRYLRQRLENYDYERDFGGVFYLFLRGMQPESGSRSGVFHDKPSRALIESLDRYLQTGRVEEVADVV
jgi:exodeoxyribonuclease V beta subunit